MCVCVCLCVCVCVHANWLKEGVAMEVHNFQIDGKTCTGFNGKVGHEPKDSRLTVFISFSKMLTIFLTFPW